MYFPFVSVNAINAWNEFVVMVFGIWRSVQFDHTQVQGVQSGHYVKLILSLCLNPLSSGKERKYQFGRATGITEVVGIF